MLPVRVLFLFLKITNELFVFLIFFLLLRWGVMSPIVRLHDRGRGTGVCHYVRNTHFEKKYFNFFSFGFVFFAFSKLILV